jgi:ABC-type transport system involved in multi-copper enzyme maturation permease subunit
VLQAFIPFVVLMTFRGGVRTEALLENFNLPLSMISIFESATRRTSGNPLGVPAEPWMVACVLHLFLAAALVFASGLMLRGIARREGGGGAGGVDPSEHIPVAAVAAAAAVDVGETAPTQGAGSPLLTYGARRPRSSVREARPRDVSDNPVLWRELRRPLTNRRWQAVLGASLAGVILLISYAAVSAGGGRGLGDPDAQIGYAIVFNGLLWLLVAVVSATSVAQEKESDTWTLLLATPVSGRTIVLGKAAGLLRRLAWPYAMVGAHFALFTVCRVIQPEALFLVLWVIVSFNMVWIATGIYLSLRLRTVTFAVILNLLLAIVIYPGAAMGLMIGGELLSSDPAPGRYRSAGSAWAQQVLWYMPYWYLGVGMEGIERARRSGGPAFISYGTRDFWLPCDPLAAPPPPGSTNPYDSSYFGRRVHAPTYFTVVFLAGSMYLMAAGTILLWTARRFDRIVGRARQIEQAEPAPAPPPAAAASA